MTDKKETSLSHAVRGSWFQPGKKTKKGLLTILDQNNEQYERMQLSAQESQAISKAINKARLGASVFSVKECDGGDCLFASTCPLVLANMEEGAHPQHGRAIIGSDCILESALMQDGIASLIENYDVDPENWTELNMVTELAEIEVLLYRLNKILKMPENAALANEQMTGVDAAGNVVSSLQVSPYFTQKEKLNNRKSKLIKLMVGDRQEKYRMQAATKKTDANELSKLVGDTRTRLETFARKPTQDQIIDAEFVSAESLFGEVEEESAPVDVSPDKADNKEEKAE